MQMSAEYPAKSHEPSQIACDNGLQKTPPSSPVEPGRQKGLPPHPTSPLTGREALVVGPAPDGAHGAGGGGGRRRAALQDRRAEERVAREQLAGRSRGREHRGRHLRMARHHLRGGGVGQMVNRAEVKGYESMAFPSQPSVTPRLMSNKIPEISSN